MKEVLNTIIEREVVPEVLKIGDIVLVYKEVAKTLSEWTVTVASP